MCMTVWIGLCMKLLFHILAAITFAGVFILGFKKCSRLWIMPEIYHQSLSHGTSNVNVVDNWCTCTV